MGIEINRARVENGEVRCELVFPNVGSFVRSLNEVLRIEAEAFAEASAKEQARWDAHVAMERDAARQRQSVGPVFSQAQQNYIDRHGAAQMATGQRIPRASMPPYDTTLGGQPVGGFMSFSEDEQKAGGTD